MRRFINKSFEKTSKGAPKRAHATKHDGTKPLNEMIANQLLSSAKVYTGNLKGPTTTEIDMRGLLFQDKKVSDKKQRLHNEKEQDLGEKLFLLIISKILQKHWYWTMIYVGCQSIIGIGSVGHGLASPNGFWRGSPEGIVWQGGSCPGPRCGLLIGNSPMVG